MCQRNTRGGLIRINEEVGGKGGQKWHFNANSIEIKYYALTS